jgi:signal peptidase I
VSFLILTKELFINNKGSEIVSNSKKKNLFSWIKTILFVVVISLLIRHFVVTPYTVKGESMMPTIQDGNYLLVSKIGDIKRFDKITFHAPDSDEDYIKRVIGLPGDKIEMKNDILYINGKAYNEPYLKEYKKNLSANQVLTPDFTLKELTNKTTIPQGYLFVLGDNRSISKDSRSFGLISIKSVTGKVAVRLWPFNKIGSS